MSDPTATSVAPTAPERSRRAAYVMLAVALLLVGTSLTAWFWRSGVMSYWNNSAADWRGAAVVETTLEQTGWRKYLEGGAWRNLPFDLPPGEVRDLGRSQHLAARQAVMIDGVNQFVADDAIGPEIEAILGNRSKLFYARYALGRWYVARGDSAKGKAMIDRAYQDAPVVLVQRYEYEDGTPAAGLKVQSIAVECNRVKKHSLDPSLVLNFWDLTTDARGCVYLPVYDTVFRVTSAANAGGLPTSYPKRGWFAAPGKVAELPVAVVRRKQ